MSASRCECVGLFLGESLEEEPFDRFSEDVGDPLIRHGQEARDSKPGATCIATKTQSVDLEDIIMQRGEATSRLPFQESSNSSNQEAPPPHNPNITTGGGGYFNTARFTGGCHNFGTVINCFFDDNELKKTLSIGKLPFAQADYKDYKAKKKSGACFQCTRAALLPASSLDTQNRVASSFIDPSIFTPSSATSSRTPTVLSSPITINSSSNYSNPLDWTSLTGFDPSVFNILDESQQATATSGATSIDFGFDTSSDASLGFPYTAIASNPTFFSLASTLNDLFAGYMSPSNTTDYNSFLANTPELAHVASSGASSVSSSSSPSELLQTPVSEGGSYPRTRDAWQKAINDSGLSPFAPPSQPSGIGLILLTKTMDSVSIPTIPCSGGSKLPKTQQSDDNVEVMVAWKIVTSHPKFKEVDMNELCSEFTAKAKCDGTKVVLELQDVNHILEAISNI